MRSLRWFGALLVLLAYALTMSRDLSLFDSPELALVAAELGLGHPPGQPLHTLLGFLFAHLPGVPTLLGLNFLSALSGALTVVPATRIAERLVVRPELSHPRRLMLVGIVCVGALHTLLWEPATRVEVYSLATLLAVWGIERVQAALNVTTQSSIAAARIHPLVVGAALLGLSACCNPVVALACALCLAPGVFRALLRRDIAWSKFVLAIIAGVAGLLPYLYVIAIADRADTFVWGAPTNSAALWSYFSGNDYARSAGVTFGQWLSHLREWLDASITRFDILWFAIGGWALAARVVSGGLGRFYALALTLLCVALVCANNVFRVDNPDYNGYLAAPFWICVAVVAAGYANSADVLGQRPIRAALWISGAALLVFSVADTSRRSRANDHVLRDLVGGALQAAPRDAMLLVESDHWIAPLLYLQRVEKARPDVVVIGAGLASSSWYWNLIYGDHPDLSPFPIKGPGGRDGRLQRFVAHHPQRPVLVESLQLGLRVGLTPCVGGALLSTRDCTWDRRSAHAFADQLHETLSRDAGRSPLIQELVALIAQQRGEDLWRLNAPNAALHTLLTGVPDSLRRGIDIPWQALHATPALRRPPITWQREPVLGAPARNAYLAAELLFTAGQREASQQLASVAVRLELAEATR